MRLILVSPTSNNTEVQLIPYIFFGNLLTQMGKESGQNELYRIAFDGTIFHERMLVAIGGRSESLLTTLRADLGDEPPELKIALSHCIRAFETVSEQSIPLNGHQHSFMKDRAIEGNPI